MSRRARAVWALLAVTVVWGFSFIWMKQGLDAAGRVLGHPGGPPVVALYMLLRFGLAAIPMMLWPGAARGLNTGVLQGGLVLGVILFVGFMLQISGLEGVSPPVSAFLTSLYVVFAAILNAIRLRARPHLPFLIGVVLATLGAGFIQGPPHVTFHTAEWLTVASAVVFAFHIIATDSITKNHAPMPVTLAMFLWTALLALIALPFILMSPGAPHIAELLAVTRDPGFAVPLMLSVVFSTVLALSLMNQYQRELDPVRAAILFALEPIWTTLIAIAMGFGRPGAWLWIGGGALLAGNLVAEWGAARDMAPDAAKPAG